MIFDTHCHLNHEDLLNRLEKFKTMTEKDIEKMDNSYVKKRNINPLVNGKRLIERDE